MSNNSTESSNNVSILKAEIGMTRFILYKHMLLVPTNLLSLSFFFSLKNDFFFIVLEYNHMYLEF